VAAKTGAALLALTLLLGGVLPASGETAAGADSKAKQADAGARGKKADAPEKRRAPLQLETVSITGSPEHPAILFFLPRAKFRLLPLRTGRDWKERLLADTKEMGDAPR
jgi:hypothetical protein